MLKIAICDDQSQESRVIETILNEYLITNECIAEISVFNHSDELLKIIENDNFHIYILDIVMPMVNGLELGKEIRKNDREAQIIYVTTEAQFALNAYSVMPINYLIKPVDKEKLFDTISLAILKLDLEDDKFFTIKTVDSLRVIKLPDILCCEYMNHSVRFILKNNEEVVTRTIRESFTDYISAIINEKTFLKCHNSFVINMRFVESFSKDSFTLKGGKVVPISKKQYSLVRDTYMDYLMLKGNK